MEKPASTNMEGSSSVGNPIFHCQYKKKFPISSNVRYILVIRCEMSFSSSHTTLSYSDEHC